MSAHSQSNIAVHPHFLATKQHVRQLLEGLNEPQADASTTMEGPLLVLAGAGSGKTRVMTIRMAMLLCHNVSPKQVLGVTFTNKAAGEMKGRLAKLLPPGVEMPTVCTFHSFCVRILRAWMPLADERRTKSFSIYDADDAKKMVKKAIVSLGFDPNETSASDMAKAISGAKNKGLGPDHEQVFSQIMVVTVRNEMRSIYARYNELLRANNAVDFDDLLLLAVKLLRENESVRNKLHQRFKHVSADEFQDTNSVQYNLIKLIVCNGMPPESIAPSFWQDRSLCVIGDDRQSIYGFRNADVAIIRAFKSQFNARCINLTINYRSTAQILALSNGVMALGDEGYSEDLVSHQGEGAPVVFKCFPDARDEARYVGQIVVKALQETPDTKIAVLYRTTAQARLFEDAMRGLGIPYSLTGGMSFFERAEIKDVLAYVRFCLNPTDDQNLTRIINTPKRNIGDTTLTACLAVAENSLYDLIGGEKPSSIKPAAWKKMQSAYTVLEQVRQVVASEPLPKALAEVLEFIGYQGYLADAYKEDHQTRWSNVCELLVAAEQFTESPNPVQEFLDYATLQTSATEEDQTIQVFISTVHGAKGLEWPTVIVAGAEDGYFPHANCTTAAQIEEERRLYYVALTRAQRELHITRATSRMVNGQFLMRAESPFAELSG